MVCCSLSLVARLQDSAPERDIDFSIYTPIKMPEKSKV